MPMKNLYEIIVSREVRPLVYIALALVLINNILPKILGITGDIKAIENVLLSLGFAAFIVYSFGKNKFKELKAKKLSFGLKIIFISLFLGIFQSLFSIILAFSSTSFYNELAFGILDIVIILFIIYGIYNFKKWGFYLCLVYFLIGFAFYSYLIYLIYWEGAGIQQAMLISSYTTYFSFVMGIISDSLKLVYLFLFIAYIIKIREYFGLGHYK